MCGLGMGIDDSWRLDVHDWFCYECELNNAVWAAQMGDMMGDMGEDHGHHGDDLGDEPDTDGGRRRRVAEKKTPQEIAQEKGDE